MKLGLNNHLKCLAGVKGAIFPQLDRDGNQIIRYKFQTSGTYFVENHGLFLHAGILAVLCKDPDSNGVR